MVSSPYLPRSGRGRALLSQTPLCSKLLSYPEHFLVIFKLILIKESTSLNVFIKKTFTISDLASLAVHSYVLRLPLYNRPFPGRQASEVHRSLENLLGRLFFNLWRLRSSLSFHHRNLSFDYFRNHTQTPSAPEVEYPKRMSCDRF